MSRVDTAAADRLPWLSDEPASATHSDPSGLRWGAIATIGLVAIVGFWMGTRSVRDEAPVAQARKPSSTVSLPVARPVAPEVNLPPQPELKAPSAPQVRLNPARDVRIAPPPPIKTAKVASLRPAVPSKPQTLTTVMTSPPVEYVPPKPWNPRIVTGAAGRLVQVGAFGSITQAKRGWGFMARAYPAMRSLPAVVRPTSNSKGRTFYRFQVGTTSQAHSEILCQRMEALRLSCAVVGLPWQAKVER